MRIAIIGGTGTLGRQIAAVLLDRGHEVRVLSRSVPEYRVDLRTGAGLDKGLRGCQAVVDASNDSSRHATEVMVEGTRRVLAAEQAAGGPFMSECRSWAVSRCRSATSGPRQRRRVW